MTPPADTPAWFSAALAAAPQERTATVEETVITYRAWGDPAGMGGAAHAR